MPKHTAQCPGTRGLALLIVAFVFLFFASGGAEEKKSPEDPFVSLKNETLSYFPILAGSVQEIRNGTVIIRTDTPGAVKPGMRLLVYREGVDFIHPVTKNPLGKVEVPVGYAEITAVSGTQAEASIVSGNASEFSGAKVKIQRTKIRLLFHQGGTEWYVGDAYYQTLKNEGRFDLIDSGVTNTDSSGLAQEAKTRSADAILILSSRETQDTVVLTQTLYWASDMKQIATTSAPVDYAIVRQLRYKGAAFGPREGEILLSYTVSGNTSRVAAGDLDGDGITDVILVVGTTLGVYKPGVDLSLRFQHSIPFADEVLWIDVIPSEQKRDLVLVTVKKDDRVSSLLLELRDFALVQLWRKENVFMRKIEGKIIGQDFFRRTGYEGGVFGVDLKDGSMNTTHRIPLPAGVNIYDFQVISTREGKRGILAWDDNGFLMVYGEDGRRLWVSREDYGGFLTRFEKDVPVMMMTAGQWSVKDRLIFERGEVIFPKRIPLVKTARTLGYRKSELRGLWWNGITVEERVFVPDISGSVVDYTIVDDRLFVVTKPIFGVVTGNLIKGDNPLVRALHVYSLKGR